MKEDTLVTGELPLLCDVVLNLKVHLISFQHCSQLKHRYLLFWCCMPEKAVSRVPLGICCDMSSDARGERSGWRGCDGVIKSDASQRGSRRRSLYQFAFLDGSVIDFACIPKHIFCGRNVP